MDAIFVITLSISKAVDLVVRSRIEFPLQSWVQQQSKANVAVNGRVTLITLFSGAPRGQSEVRAQLLVAANRASAAVGWSYLS